jgi:hypothetical protein
VLEKGTTAAYVSAPDVLETRLLQALQELNLEPASTVETLGLIAKELKRMFAMWGMARDDAERLSKYLLDIGDTLDDAAHRISAGQPGGSTCREIAVFATELEQVIGDRELFRSARDGSVAATKQRLRDLLDTARFAWGPPPGQERVIRVLRETAMARRTIGPDATSEQRIDEEFRRLPDAQVVWDAAGEFRGLAKTLRARDY